MPMEAKVQDEAKALPLGQRRTFLPGSEAKTKSGRSANIFASLVFSATDLLVFVVCFLCAQLLFPQKDGTGFSSLLAARAVWLPFFLVAFAMYGLYPGLCLAPAEELKRYTIATFLVTGIGMAVHTDLFRVFDGYDAVCIVGWLMCIPLLWACRVAVRSFAAHSPLWGVPIVVFCYGKEANDLIDRLLRCRWIGYRPALIVADEPSNGAHYRGIPIVYGFPEGFALAQSLRFSTSLISLPRADLEKYREVILRYAKAFPTLITFSDFINVTGVWARFRDFEGVLGLSTQQRLLRPFNVAVKRIFDVILVCMICVLALPISLVLMLLVKLDSPGPIIYRHQRLGKGGKKISVLKFRTMVVDADRRLAELFGNDPTLNSEWNDTRKLKKDPRVTRIGRFLRATSLDELPQLWNVLKGDMSLIGPRPIVREEVECFSSAWYEISRVLPGMTGLWQVSGRSDTGYDTRVELDTYYIQNWSIWLDIYILMKTVWIVLAQKGAY